MTGAYLHVRRIKQWMSRFRKFRVVLDGDCIGKIKCGAAAIYEIAPGVHSLMVTIDWVSSDAVAFRCEAGEHVRFVCGHPSPTWRAALNVESLVDSIDLIPDDESPTPNE